MPVRREVCEANERQPEAVLRASAQPAKRWSAKVDATMPAGGKNKGRKSSGLGPFFGATKEDAEAARNKALFDWMHAPTRAPKKQKVADMSASASGSSQEQSATMRRTGDVRCRGVSRIMSGYPRISISRDVPGYPALLLLYCILVLPEYTILMSTVHHSHEYTTLTVCMCKCSAITLPRCYLNQVFSRRVLRFCSAPRHWG